LDDYQDYACCYENYVDADLIAETELRPANRNMSAPASQLSLSFGNFPEMQLVRSAEETYPLTHSSSDSDTVSYCGAGSFLSVSSGAKLENETKHQSTTAEQSTSTGTVQQNNTHSAIGSSSLPATTRSIVSDEEPSPKSQMRRSVSHTVSKRIQAESKRI